jgi:hypothetical protein
LIIAANLVVVAKYVILYGAVLGTTTLLLRRRHRRRHHHPLLRCHYDVDEELLLLDPMILTISDSHCFHRQRRQRHQPHKHNLRYRQEILMLMMTATMMVVNAVILVRREIIYANGINALYFSLLVFPKPI